MTWVRPALEGLTPYEPGKALETVQRELGLAQIVKLASNEGAFGPLPAALAAIERTLGDLRMYPDGSCYELRAALAERHGVSLDRISVGAGADGLIDCLAQAVLDPGDEIVCGWPSFPSYALAARKRSAIARLIPLHAFVHDLDRMLEAITRRTKLLYLCYPNNPTGTVNPGEEIEAFLDKVPPSVLTVIDQAYFEYVESSDYVDGIDRWVKTNRPVLSSEHFQRSTDLQRFASGMQWDPARSSAPSTR